MNDLSFSTLDLRPELLTNLKALELTVMTPIQAESLPHLLAGKDMIAQAETGSGKTAAFALALLQKLDTQSLHTQAVVLCPTRELADQVANDIRKLARTIGNIKILALCGGIPFKPQANSLVHGAHIIVGTPGRIQDHLTRETLKLDKLETLVLDEADRMLDMGFKQAIADIVKHIPKTRQTLLFSATYSGQVKSIAKTLLDNPKMIKVASIHKETSIEQHFFEVASERDKNDALLRILLDSQPESAVVFCNTKQEARDVTDHLMDAGFSALDLTGDLEQRDRDQTLIQFSNKSISILVATDVAARGLDIDKLTTVINYNLAHDPESHVHRIGRTGRAGNQGTAFTLFTPAEGHKIALLEDVLQQPVQAEPLPSQDVLTRQAKPALMQTLQIGGGKKQKVRAGDILGALTSEGGIQGSQVGKINIGDNWSYVAVVSEVSHQAQKKLSQDKIKGRSLRIRRIGKDTSSYN
ncbi:MAG: ATP-dependent RNA helicase DbpA [Ghiorsea sp.]